MKTLYVTDLDGTLLDNDSRVSKRSAAMLCQAIEKGALFSVATGRTPATVSTLMAEIPMQLPAIVMTGALMWLPGSMQYYSEQYISTETMRLLYDTYYRCQLPVFIYRKPNTVIEITHYGRFEDSERIFMQQRSGTVFKKFLEPIDKISEQLSDYNNVLLCYSMSKGNSIVQAYKEIKKLPGLSPILYNDIFGPETAILEVFAESATKAGALKKLKQQIGAERVVAFGDNINDLPLLAEADHSVAVANAVPQVKAIADEIIGANVTDAVAEYILRDLK